MFYINNLTDIFVYSLNILKGKRNAYFEFQNGGFILRAVFFFISAIYIL